MTVPLGIPQVLPPRAVAAAVAMTERSIRYLLDAGQLPHIPCEKGQQRRVRASDLIAYAEPRCLQINWEAVLETLT
jgi:hypothetical protein